MSPFAAIAARPRLAAVLGALAIAFSGIFYRWSGEDPSGLQLAGVALVVGGIATATGALARIVAAGTGRGVAAAA
jgi:drug/metabolite transporter (DMT)-like permease